MSLIELIKRAVGLVLTAVFVLCIASYAQAQSRGKGYEHAPACSHDIDRRFSTAIAGGMVDEAEKIAGGSEDQHVLVERLLMGAFQHLEGVAERGALVFQKCLSCDLGKPDWKGEHRSYISVAEKAFAMSERLLDRARSEKFMNLVKQARLNYSALDYCGYVASQTDVSSVNGSYEFGRLRPVHRIICNPGEFKLTANISDKGRPIDSCEREERYYWLFDEKLVFLNSRGEITTVMRPNDNGYWEGPRLISGKSLVDEDSRYIKRVAGQIIGPKDTSRYREQKSYVVYYNKRDYTCCKGDVWLRNIYPFVKSSEAPHPLRIDSSKKLNVETDRVIQGGFETFAEAKTWVCSHKVRKSRAGSENVARLNGVLVSNLPCEPNIR